MFETGENTGSSTANGVTAPVDLTYHIDAFSSVVFCSPGT
jgi:hypothetical protein